MMTMVAWLTLVEIAGGYLDDHWRDPVLESGALRVPTGRRVLTQLRG